MLAPGVVVYLSFDESESMPCSDGIIDPQGVVGLGLVRSRLVHCMRIRKRGCDTSNST